MKHLFFLMLLCFTASLYADSLPSLSQAVVDNNQVEIDRLLKSKPSQEEIDSALGAAAGKNNLVAAHKLISAGADPNKDHGVGNPNTVIAVREGNAEVLEVLLKEGADPNSSNMFSWRPLHHAVTAEMECVKCIEVLVKNGADVDAVTTLKVTPLHRAAGFGHGDAVQALLAAGASKTLKDKYGNNAYARAMNNGHEKVTQLLQ